MALNKTKKESASIIFSKITLGLCAIVSFIVISSIALYVFTEKIDMEKILPNVTKIKAIEVSSDSKSILNSETKKIVFTIEDANKYLKNSSYAYDPDTFQDTNAKYAGDCFGDAALSNNKNRIVFSTGCLAGDLSQAWIGVYNLVFDECPPGAMCKRRPLFMFLTGGSGKNFVWSADDKTIAYEADLGLSGITEMRTIDAGTGEILERKSGLENNDLQILDKINKLYENNANKIKEISSIDSNSIDIYTISNESGGNYYPYVDEPAKLVSIFKNKKTIGVFESNPNFHYIPVYANENEIFMVAPCGGLGGRCRGEFSKYNILKKEKIEIAGGIMDFFITADKRNVIYFTLDDDWQRYKMFFYDFESNQTIDQSINLICEIGGNITKGCRDLFLENNGEIIYLPLDYKNIAVGTSYKLSKTNNSKAEEFSAANFDEIILTYGFTKDETADWQTYRNEELGFEFKYPSKLGKVVFEINPERYTPEGGKIGMKMEGKFSDNSSIIFGGVTDDYTAVSRETSKVGYFGGYLENNGVYFYGFNAYKNEFYGEMMPKKIINNNILLIDCKSFIKQCLIVDSYMMNPYTIEEEIKNKTAGLINLKKGEFKGLIISANSEFIKEDDFIKILSTIKIF